MRFVLPIFLLTLAPAMAHAETISCPWKVDHVQVEEGHDNPPATLVPDIGADGETPQQEWNGLHSASFESDRGVTIHCFADQGEKKQYDLALPYEIKSCVLRDQTFSCGQQ